MLGMLPAQKRLDAGEGVAPQIEVGLLEKEKLLVGECCIQVDAEVAAAGKRGQHFEDRISSAKMTARRFPAAFAL